jgi:hypothetical protein
MRTIFIVLTYVFGAGMLFSCESTDTANVSFVTTYPTITLEGDPIVVSELGTAFADPGAIAKVGDTQIEVEVVGQVDSNSPGVYAIRYTATNSDGFSRTESRQVVIYDPATDAVDLSGEYLRAATGVTVTVTKVAPSTYHINDAGGFGDTFLDVIFVHTEGDELVVPLQVAPASGITVETIPGTGVITDDGFEWQLNASSFYGTALRSFTKL